MSPLSRSPLWARLPGRRREFLSLVALLAALAALLAGVVTACGGGRNRSPSSPAAIPTATCAQKGLAKLPLAGESVYRAGPVTLAVVDYADLGELSRRQLSHPLGSKAIAVVTGDRPVVVAVDPGSRRRFSLQFTPERGFGSPLARIRDGRPTVRFPACGRGAQKFGGGVLFAGPGCVHLRVESAGGPPIPLGIPIGASPKGCPAPPNTQQLSMSALPYLGVSCRIPNSISCDRVGIGVWLDRPAKRITVALAGRVVALRLSSHNPHRNLWLGYLYNAGLRHGQLDVHLPAGESRWSGSPLVWVRVRVSALLSKGATATLAGSAQLHPGFG